MVDATQIMPKTSVASSKSGQFAVVDHVEGVDRNELAKAEKGVHHYHPARLGALSCRIPAHHRSVLTSRRAFSRTPTIGRGAEGHGSGRA